MDLDTDAPSSDDPGLEYGPRPLPLGALLLLEPSCVLAMIALVPRVLEAPTVGTAGALTAVLFAAIAPIVVVVAAARRRARA